MERIKVFFSILQKAGSGNKARKLEKYMNKKDFKSQKKHGKIHKH
jgi:hypothetical protein